jgi:hypothetical protein
VASGFLPQVEEGCGLTTVDDIAAAVHHVLCIIDDDAATQQMLRHGSGALDGDLVHGRLVLSWGGTGLLQRAVMNGLARAVARFLLLCTGRFLLGGVERLGVIV